MIIVFGGKYNEEILDIEKKADTCMQKKNHPYKIQYCLCSIICVSETTPFVWPPHSHPWKPVAMTVKKNNNLGRILPAFTKELFFFFLGWNERLHLTSNVQFNQRRRGCSLWSLTGIFGTIVHHWQPLDISFPSGTSLTVCGACEISSSRQSWLNLPVFFWGFFSPFFCWLDIIWALIQRREFHDHLTSLINKSSRSVMCILSNLQ